MRTIGEKIRNHREALRLSQTQLAKEANVDVTSLNKLEKGKLDTPSRDFLDKIAKRLNVSPEELTNNEETLEGFKIGIGSTLWAAPLLYLMTAEDRILDKINLTYFEHDGQMVFYNRENKVDDESDKDIKPEDRNLLSAQELRAYLNAFDLHAIFIPAVALRGERANISKICSIMNTVEGGLDVLLFSPNGKMPMNLEAVETKTEDEEPLEEGAKKKKKPKEKNEKVKEKSQWYNILDRLLANDNKGSFIFKQDTVAEAGFSRMILGNKDWKSKSSFKQIPVKRQENMDDVLNNHLNSGLSNDDYCIMFTWEPQTSEIEHSLTARNHKPIRIPAHIFSADEKPTFYITFDLVARTEKLQELKDSKAFNNFLRTLQDGINGIEEDIKQEVMHYSLRKIASMLGFKNEEDYLKIHKRLHEINFQLQFYPDWVFASKSSKPNLGDQMG